MRSMPGVTRGQCAFLAALFAALWIMSFLWWKNNANRDALIAAHPEWESSGFVLYDGYGEYARHLKAAAVSPSKETRGELRSFAANYVHAPRPVFPLVVAAVDIPVRNLAVSASVANLASVVALFLVWNALLVRFFGFEGTDLFLLHLLALTHVSTIGSLARPVADVMAMAFVLGAILATCDFERTGRLRSAGLALALVIAGAATKMIAALLLPAIVLSVAASKRRSPGGKAIIAAGVAGLALMVAAGALLLRTDTASGQFMRAALAGPAELFTSPALLPGFLKSGIVFLALSLQIWVVCAVFNRSALSSPARLFLLWGSFYLLQRFLFYGFSLWHSRARYGFPLVAAAIVLGYPGLKRLAGPRAARYACFAVAGLNLAVWLAVYIRET